MGQTAMEVRAVIRVPVPVLVGGTESDTVVQLRLEAIVIGSPQVGVLIDHDPRQPLPTRLLHQPGFTGIEREPFVQGNAGHQNVEALKTMGQGAVKIQVVMARTTASLPVFVLCVVARSVSTRVSIQGSAAGAATYGSSSKTRGAPGLFANSTTPQLGLWLASPAASAE